VSDPAVQPDPVVLRPWTPADRDFIESTWRRNYERVGRWASCPGGLQEYIATQAAVIATCLASSDVLVACPPERPEQILGWCCFRPPATVHYVYVKPYYRRMGLATRLLRGALGDATCVWITHMGQRGPGCDGISALMTKAERIEYNPALIFGAQRQEWMPR